jgi:NADPH-dependent glutamate synthase beta subunit-like oxidoreductase/Pyruvate/2-oxoacid:ferredoxin oxidoreductase delta subunit
MPERRVPPVAISQTSTLATKTGAWKYIRPVYRDRVAPCNAGCPVGIDIEAYMNLLREGRWEEARDVLLLENPLPAVTGRVCHHPCEARCNRRQFDEPVAIHAVERLLGDYALEHPPALSVPPSRDGEVGIVGSGPAGLACAYHLARLGYGVTVFDAASDPGGMLRLGIPEYRLPRRILEGEIERLRALGVSFQCGVRIGQDISWRCFIGMFDAVFVATGAHVGKALGVESEGAAGVRAGLDFLKAVNRGERPEIGRRVVVVGGGNTAMDCARAALRLGADATVLYRRTRAEMPAIPEEIAEAEREGARLVFLAAPAKFQAPDGRLRAVECIRMHLGDPDASGRRRPIPIPDDRFTIQADTVLAAIGESADLSGLPAEVALRDGGVAVDPLGATSRVALFAGGDLTNQPRSVADAIGAGKRAAVGIDRYLRHLSDGGPDGEGGLAARFANGNISMARWRGVDPVPRVNPQNELVPFDDLNVNHFRRLGRHRDRRLGVAESLAGFAEVNLGLERGDAVREALRCFNCGVCNRCDLCLMLCPDVAISRRQDGAGYEIALDYCKGCGVCAEECPRGVLTMTREGW